MNKAFTAFVAVALGLCLATGANAAVTNTGKLSHPFSGHHLTNPEAVVGGHGLYCPSEADDAAFRSAIAAAMGGGAVVDYYDARVGVPSLSGYTCAYTWANYAYFDAVGMGNALADFVDAGGTVVLGAFCVYTAGNTLQGRIVDDPAYCPVSGGFNHFAFATWGGDDAGECIFQNVSGFGATYRDFLVVDGTGAGAFGHFTDGEIATAHNAGNTVTYANGAGGFPIDGNGPDWPTVVANACACSGPIANETTTWGAVKDLYR